MEVFFFLDESERTQVIFGEQRVMGELCANTLYQKN